MVRSLFTLLLTIICLSLYAQTPVKDINSIKLNPNYIWAEATEDTKEKAEEAANISLALLIRKNNSSLSQKTIKASIAKCSQMCMNRGEMYRVFVYMEKKLLTEIASREDTASASEASASVCSDSSLKPWQQNIIGKIIGCKRLDKVVNYLDRLNAQNKITVMGTKSRPPRNPQKAFYVFFDNMHNTKAVLGKESDGKRRNYMTNKMETTEEYLRDAFVWFVLPN